LDTEKANKLFGRNDLSIDTSFLADNLFMTAFKEQLGPQVLLEIHLSLKKPKVRFGTDPNVIMNF